MLSGCAGGDGRTSPRLGSELCACSTAEHPLSNKVVESATTNKEKCLIMNILLVLQSFLRID
jgi:hypothetical protein